MKDELKSRIEGRELVPSAPNVRGTVALIRLGNQDDVEEFSTAWKQTDHEYGDANIHARPEKTPEKRKSNAKIYLMTEALQSQFSDKEIEPNY